ncbi:MAG: shikimate kinase [Fimbriimonadaceae bacterium]
MCDKAWILVGMMGVGKTTVAKLLAEKACRPLYDLDRMLVTRLGRPVPQLFQIYGEVAFRGHETSLLKSIEPGPSVVSTGGGIVLKPENWTIMRQLGTIIYLQAPLDVLIDRLAKSRKRRPLLQVDDPEEKITEILTARDGLYRQADVIVELGDSSAESATGLVLEALQWKA